MIESVCDIGGIILAEEYYSIRMKNVSQCQFAHHKFHMDWPGI
jgi:hypothetical protein